MCVKEGLKQNNGHKEISKLSPQCSQTCRNVLVLRCHQLDEYQVLKMEGDNQKKVNIYTYKAKDALVMWH